MNLQMKIAICDDDPQDRSTMVSLVQEYLDINNYHVLVDQYLTGESFLESQVDQYSLVILDIYMGNLNGLETAKQLIADHPGIQIIFCSTTDDFAVESYDVSALRYFIKPISREKLFVTLDRFFHAHTALRTLTYKCNRMDESVYIQDVLWIEAANHRSVIHTKSANITTPTSFAQLVDQLSDADFIKPIRHALVSLQAIAAIPTDELVLIDGSRIPISRNLRAETKHAFTQYKMRKLLQKGGVRT